MSTITSVSNAGTSLDFSSIQKQVQQIQDQLSSWQGALSSAMGTTSSASTTTASSSASTSATTTPDTSAIDEMTKAVQSLAAQIDAYRWANPAVSKALSVAPASTPLAATIPSVRSDVKFEPSIQFNPDGIRIDQGQISMIKSVAAFQRITPEALDQIINPDTYQARKGMYG
jgi:hypothetical protein